MRRRFNKQAVAEWILSRAMPLERAQATVGDLVEYQLGAFGFWIQIAKTAAAFAWQGIVADGLELTIDAVVGWIAWGIIIMPFDLLKDARGLYYSSHTFHQLSAQIWPLIQHYWVADGFFRWFGWMLWSDVQPSHRRLAGAAIAVPMCASLSILTGVRFEPSFLWLVPVVLVLNVPASRLYRRFIRPRLRLVTHD